MKSLYGIGTGPGAADLLTLRAVNIMKKADVIFTPNNKGKNMALDTARDFIKDKKIIYIDFPMGMVEEEHYKLGADLIYREIPEDGLGVFLTIGDPMIYSTYIYLLEALENYDIQTEIVPGIPSFVAAAAEAKIQLTEKDDNFILCDSLNSKILELADSVAILKTFKEKEKTIDLLEKYGFTYKYIKRVSLEEEEILDKREEILEDRDYISLIIGRKGDL